MFDPNKATQKTAEVVNASLALAQEESHQQVTPVHLALVLFEEPEGVARQVCLKVGSEDTWRSICRVLRKHLVKLPKIEPAPEEVFPSREYKTLLNQASKLQKQRGDAYLGVDVLLLAAITASDVTAALEEAGVSRSQFEAAVKEVRAQATHIQSETGDQNFQALQKYGTDLTANAARLDPVIGRDDGGCLHHQGGGAGWAMTNLDVVMGLVMLGCTAQGSCCCIWAGVCVGEECSTCSVPGQCMC
jgi:ATP-dependent Clp protease ATP-binding subunit ClpB